MTTALIIYLTRMAMYLGTAYIRYAKKRYDYLAIGVVAAMLGTVIYSGQGRDVSAVVANLFAFTIIISALRQPSNRKKK